MKRYDPKIWRISANNRAFHKLETTPLVSALLKRFNALKR